jgi:hypothetical protein
MSDIDHTALAAEVAATLDAINAGISTIGTLRTATPTVIGPLVTTVDNGQDVIEAQIDALDADIVTDSFAGIVTGVAAPELWTVLIEQTASVVQLANLLDLHAYVGRARTNLSIAPP